MSDTENMQQPADRRERAGDALVAFRWPLALVGLALLVLVAYWLTLERAADSARAVGEAAGQAADRMQEMAEGFFSGDVTESFVSSMPKVERAEEGRLEVATAEITETLSRSDERLLLWDALSLGTTTVEVQVPVTYRYHVRLEDAWKVEVRGPVALVLAPEIRPSLPPAIHTDRMRTRTEESPLRFDGADRLEELHKSLTPRLVQRAESEGHKDLVREEARRRVAHFVQRWLLDQQFWTDDRFATIKVVFPDEAPADWFAGAPASFDLDPLESGPRAEKPGGGPVSPERENRP